MVISSHVNVFNRFLKASVRESLALSLIIVYYFFVAGLNLKSLPGEWYGDISIVHERVQTFLQGSFSWEYSLSAGPLPLLATSLFAWVFGSTYLTYKIASVSMGAANLIFVYLLAKELAGKKVGLLAATLGSVTFWHLVVARIGNTPLIFSVLLASMSGWLAIRFVRTKGLIDVWLSLGIAFLGLWTYPAVFPLPLVPLFSVLQVFHKKISRKTIVKIVGMSVVSVGMGFGLFFMTVSSQRYNFTQGYIGHKLFLIDGCEAHQNQLTKACMTKLAKNSLSRLVSTLGMFHVHGDEGFRTNVSNMPHLDTMSGVLLLIGLGFWLKNKKVNRLSVLLPIAVLLLPTLAPGIPYKEVPSLPRTLGILPYVLFLTAFGLEKVSTLAGKFQSFVTVGIIFAVAYLNLSHYFGAYARGLPEDNEAWAGQIAHYVDSFSPDTAITLTNCCWGEFGQPEPKAILYSMRHQEGREHLAYDSFVDSCDEIDSSKSRVIIFRPSEKEKIQEFISCFPQGKVVHHKDARGAPNFTSMEILTP